MKNITICLCVIVLLTGICVFPVFAQEQKNSNLFQGELTYIRYRLDRNTLPRWEFESIAGLVESDPDTTFLTLENTAIDRIDAYVEIADFDFTLGNRYIVQHDAAGTVEASETPWIPGSSTARTICVDIQDVYADSFGTNDNDNPFSYNSPGASWNIGDIALVLDYDKIYENLAGDRYSRDEHLIRGKLNMPLGESGFSFDAYLAMYTAGTDHVYEILPERSTPQGIVQIPVPEILEEVGNTAQATFVESPSGRSDPVTTYASVSKGMTPRSAVAGAVNFSGALRGVDVFTEVGFAGTGEDPGDTVADDLRVASFYALGGAKYTVGQVTLGVEAGFENGDAPIDNLTENFSGFENDFEFDRLLEDGIPGDEFHNKLYAKLSAHLNPTEKIRVEGAFSCVKPVEDGSRTGSYGFEINGTFYYSLADYIKYLVKAGVASSEDDFIEDSQYKIMNKLEFRF